ncbi:DUF4377 domain-containing protein [Saccharicrinis sp. FJH62]|uniref:DUF4377 domain-containing protein n=1 Tax=Saccharicrinis sp. FJH62 TaxID=3344657 RepID=UPI0035D4B24E
MRKLPFILFLAILLTACEKDDTTEIVNLRINHYQQPANFQELFYGLSYWVEEEDEIGTGIWKGFAQNIHGFDYELGYIYNIKVQKKYIEDPPIDAPAVTYTLERIISKTKVPEETTFDIELTIEYSNGFESLVVKNENSEFTLLHSTKIECGDLYDKLNDDITNKKSITGTFTHIDKNSIRLIKLSSTKKY